MLTLLPCFDHKILCQLHNRRLPVACRENCTKRLVYVCPTQYTTQ